MNTKALFGRYWDADSAIHALDARTKILGVLALVVIIFLARNFYALAALTVFLFLCFMIARVPILQAIRSILPLSFIILLTALFNVFFVHGGDVLVAWGWLTIDSDGLYSAAFTGLRLTLLLLAGSLLTLTTTSFEITEAFEKLLSPFARFGFPAHEFAFVMGLALRFLPEFADEFHSIRNAQIARGVGLATSPFKSGVSSITCLIVPLFASVFRHADVLSAAMDARCYHGAAGRTQLHPLQFASRDIWAAVVLAGLLGAVLGLSCL